MSVFRFSESLLLAYTIFRSVFGSNFVENDTLEVITYAIQVLPFNKYPNKIFSKETL